MAKTRVVVATDEHGSYTESRFGSHAIDQIVASEGKEIVNIYGQRSGDIYGLMIGITPAAMDMLAKIWCFNRGLSISKEGLFFVAHGDYGVLTEGPFATNLERVEALRKFMVNYINRNTEFVIYQDFTNGQVNSYKVDFPTEEEL